MAGGKRTDRVSARDVEVLGFIARFGLVSRAAVAAWAATGHSVTFARERRLREAGLIEVGSQFWGAERLIVPTAAGLRLSGFQHLGRARFSASSARHEAAVAGLAAQMERQGRQVLSEREIIARERIEGRRLFSVEVEGGRRLHRCDLLGTEEGVGAPEAIEVELTAKGTERLDLLLRSWRRAIGQGRFSGVVYRCPTTTRGLVQRAVERTRTSEFVRVEEL
jgi:hypothetical protein